MKPTANIAKQITLPRHMALSLAIDPRFSRCIEASLEADELVENFERLSGIHRPRPPRNGLEALIDKETGYVEDQYRVFFEAFIVFVHDCVYVRMLECSNITLK